MYKHRYIVVVFALTLALLCYADWRYDLPWYSYLLWAVSYPLVVFWGVYFIQLNYFTQVYCRGDKGKKQIAITFDDGPQREYTPLVLDILKNEKVPATFFLIGKNIKGNEDIVRRMTDEGHLVGNHSFRHGFWFSIQPKAKMADDLALCDKEIARVIGKRPALFRPPYGVTNPTVAKVMRQGTYTGIGWSLRTYDTNARSRKKLLDTTLKNVRNGEVILFHDWGKYTVGILSEFIGEVRRRGFEIVRIDALLQVNPYRS